MRAPGDHGSGVQPLGLTAVWVDRMPDRVKRTRGTREDAGSGSTLTLRIVLDDLAPPIWRRIQVPSTFNFWELHVAIQDAMGWRDTHLHEFRASEPHTGRPLVIGIPDEEQRDECPTEPGWTVPVAPILTPGASIRYLYDFGDDWHHTITCEARVPREPGARYPRCLDGARACPPEDVGGPPGYTDFLHAVLVPTHEDHATMLEWVGGRWDAEQFDARAVRFTNAKTRLRRLLSH
jgi:hypothetical protein